MAKHITTMKEVEFLGDSLEVLRGFPDGVCNDIGYQLHKIQAGKDPDDFKPMKTVGKGVYEIRVRDSSGAYRAFYIATRKDCVYVLHCFQKKTEETLRKEIKKGKERLKSLPPE